MQLGLLRNEKSEGCINMASNNCYEPHCCKINTLLYDLNVSVNSNVSIGCAQSKEARLSWRYC